MANVITIAIVLSTLAPLIVLLNNSVVRFGVVLFGAALVFQSSDGITLPKLAYIVVLAVALLLALPEASGRIVRLSAATGIVLTSLCVAAVVRGNDPALVVRDAANYLLLLTAAPLALHFGKRIGSKTIRRLTFTIALLGAYAFVARWTSTRHLARLPTLGLPSGSLFALGVAACAARAVQARRSARWWAACAALIAGGIATGTRNLVLFALAPIVIGLWSSIRGGVRARRVAHRAVVTALVVIPAAFALSLAGAGSVGIDVTAALARVSTITTLSQNNASASLVQRKIEQDLAWKTFMESPVTGGGPGTVWHVYRPTSNVYTEQFTLDTSFVLLAKWGLFGTVAISALLIGWWQVLRPQKRAPTFWGLSALGFASVFLASGLLTSTIEDKGLPLVLMLLGAGSVAEKREGSAPLDAASRPVDACPRTDRIGADG